MTRARVPSLVAAAMLLAASAAAAENPLEAAHAAALADARKLGPAAVGVRYLTTYNVAEAKRAELRQVVDFAVNSLSREAEIVRTRFVTPTLLRLSIYDYGFDPATWDKLADADPYFHVRLKVEAHAIGKAYFSATATTKAGWYAAKAGATATEVAAIAPWLPTAEAAELVALTQTAAPILRADWWFSTVAIQAGRKGVGYYDWLEIKNRADLDKLAGLNVKESQRLKKEVGDIIARSGVSNFPRQVFRFQSITGGFWETRDVITDNKDARNAIRQLDGDYKFEALEIYFHLANDLFGYGLFNNKGERQDSAPDGIGYDKTAGGNDGKIHAGLLSCPACHVEGLRPLRSFSRQVFNGPLKLSSPDADTARRIRQIYLGEIEEKRIDDAAKFAKALKRASGLTPEANAKAVRRVYDGYTEANLLPADMAADLGVTEEAYLTTLRAAFAANPLADPVLAGHLARVPVPIRRDDGEQLAPLIYATILGTPGKGKP